MMFFDENVYALSADNEVGKRLSKNLLMFRLGWATISRLGFLYNSMSILHGETTKVIRLSSR